MHLRRRISDEINARVLAKLPAAAATVWDKSAVAVIIEQAKFRPAGGFVKGGFDRLFSIEATVRVQLVTDDLDDLDLGEELVASLLCQPIFLIPDTVEIGAITETSAVQLTDMRVQARDAGLIFGLTFTASADVLRYHGHAVVPHTVFTPRPLNSIGEAPL